MGKPHFWAGAVTAGLLLVPLAVYAQDAGAPVVPKTTGDADATAQSPSSADVGAPGGAPAEVAEAPQPYPHSVEVPVPAPAQPTTAPAVRNRLVEEVIVTANKREENVQDIPQSVTAFSNDKLEAVGVQTVQDLPSITPGLTITNQAGYNQAFLRGVGTDAFLPGADASVPFYLDGIPLLGTQGSSDSLGKIQRVEVLKGPQGTLFGTNAIGGAINIITPEPKHAFSGDVQLGAGNYNAQKASLFLNLPIADSLAASIALYGSAQDNFYVNDLSPPMIDVYSFGGRLKVLWELTEDLDNTISLSFNKMSNNAGLNFENTLPAPRVGGISPIPADPAADRHVSYDNFGVGAVNHSWLLADTLAWRTSLFDVKGIGSWQQLVSDRVTATFGAGTLALAQQDSTSKQITGELQVLSNADTPFSDRLTWVGGLFYTYSEGGLDPFRFILAENLLSYVPGLTSSPLGAFLINNGLYNPNANITLYNRGVIGGYSMSGYFQGTLAVTDDLSVILGARYQHTRKQLTKSQTSYPLGDTEVVLISDTLPVLHANQISPRVGLQYRFDAQTQAYASWARGFKTPTYNTVNLTGSLLSPINPVKAQRNDAYELGLKTELFDRNLRVNSALFYTKEKDLLTGTVQVLSGGIVNYDNAPAARIFGAETDILATPLPDLDPGLAITFSAAYLNTKYTDYKNGRGYDPATGIAYGPGLVLPLLPARDQTGNEIPRSPKFTGNLGVAQTFMLDSGSLEFAVDGNYNSGFYWSAQNASIEKTFSYHLLNAHATYMYSPWNAEIEAWIKNLTNETYYQTIFVDDFGRSVILNDPRTFGVRLKWTF